jgi:5-methylcytosine-specific restriction endonuclease McrA
MGDFKKRARYKTGSGILFQDAVKSVFLRVTGQTYDNMLVRIRKKGFPGLPFDKDAFRDHVLSAMGGNYDGYFRCQYCNGFFTLEQVAVDHAHSLGRAGGVELSNLDYPCKPCNARKGTMLPAEYHRLLKFLDDELPLAKTDILQRLEISVQLAAADRARRAKEKRQMEAKTF